MILLLFRPRSASGAPAIVVTGRFDFPSPAGGFDGGTPTGGFDPGTPAGGFDEGTPS